MAPEHRGASLGSVVGVPDHAAVGSRDCLIIHGTSLLISRAPTLRAVGTKGRRRTRIIVGSGLAVIALVVVAVFGVRLWLTAEPGEVGVDETLDEFREQAADVVIETPVDGVYVYDTTGTEQVDVLGGDSHEYPAETAMTVMTEGCGVRTTWAPLDGRSETMLLCLRNGGAVLRETTTVHSFFRQSQATPYVCEPEVWWVPPDGVSEWSGQCTSSDRTTDRVARVVATDSFVVDGEARDAVHVRYTDTLAGASTGTVTGDLWLDRRTGLILRQRLRVDSRNDTVVGEVVFIEELELSLRSLEPLR